MNYSTGTYKLLVLPPLCSILDNCNLCPIHKNDVLCFPVKKPTYWVDL